MGDSSSDEYRADNNRGGAYAAVTFNWMEQLVRVRGVNAGAWGTRTEPRRTGYQFNWARSGARAADVISQGQAAGVANQVAGGQVSHALLMIGTNDFALWNGTYQEIYNGSLSGLALTNKLDAIVANMRQAITTVKAAGPVKMFVATLIDRGQHFAAAFPDAARRQLVTNAILSVNAQVWALAAETGTVVFDYYSFGSVLLPRMDGAGSVRVGSEVISLTAAGDEPHHAVLGDNEHLGTVVSGLFANYVLETLNAHGFGIEPFTDQEILETAGIVADTEAPEVTMTGPAPGAVVSGTVAVTAAASDNVGVAGVQFRLDGANLGAEDTTAPYSVSWTTGIQQNGVRTLTAVARDAAGGTAAALAITVTVLNVDTTAPTVSLTSPSSGATIVGNLSVSASASDNVGVAGVTFLRNGVAIGAEDTVSPYSITVPTDYTQNGSITLAAVARDAAGNTRTSGARTVTIANPVPDTGAPVVAITAPAAGTTVSSLVTVTASASDNVKVAGVRFRLDGATLGSEDTSAPFSVSWSTISAANGPHTLTATARDAAGNTTTASVNVTVENIPQLFQPASYAVTQGTYQSGNASSVAADDSVYLVAQSTRSGTTRYTRTEFEFLNTPASPLRLDLTVIARSTASTTVRVYAYSVSSASWKELTSVSVGTSEVTRTVSITSNPGQYRDSSGRVRLRVQGSRSLANFTISHELVRLGVLK
jgi:hypothetical protein